MSIAEAGQQSRLAFVLPLCEWEPENLPADIAKRVGGPALDAASETEVIGLDAIINLASTLPIDQKGFDRVATEGGAVWRFDVDRQRTIRLVSHRNPVAADAIVTFRAELRTEELKGEGVLELKGAPTQGATAPRTSCPAATTT